MNITETTQAIGSATIGGIFSKIFYFSGVLANYAVKGLNYAGLNLTEVQLKVLLTIISAIILLLTIKFGERLSPLIKVIIILLLVYLVIGLFMGG